MKQKILSLSFDERDISQNYRSFNNTNRTFNNNPFIVDPILTFRKKVPEINPAELEDNRRNIRLETVQMNLSPRFSDHRINNEDIIIDPDNNFSHSIEVRDQNEIESIVIYNWFCIKFWKKVKGQLNFYYNKLNNKIQIPMIQIYYIILYIIANVELMFVTFSVALLPFHLILGLLAFASGIYLTLIEFYTIYIICTHKDLTKIIILLNYIIGIYYFFIFIVIIILEGTINAYFYYVSFSLLFFLLWIKAFVIVILIGTSIFYFLISLTIEFVYRLFVCKLIPPFYIIHNNVRSNEEAINEQLITQNEIEYDSYFCSVNFCTICLEHFEERCKIFKLSCHITHIFHSKCLKLWARLKNECPNCRASIKFARLIR